MRRAKLIAKTKAARVFLNRLFSCFQNWNGEWVILNEAKERKGQKGNWFLIAPSGHPWDKQERWIDASRDRHFTVLFSVQYAH